MDMSPAGPSIPLWLVAGTLFVVLAGAAALLALRLRRGRRRRSAGGAADPAGRDPGGDDLPAFLAFPPGSAGAPGPPPHGWPALTAPAPASTMRAEEAPARGARRRAAALAALAVTALVLLAVAYALDPGPRRSEADSGGGTDGRGEVRPGRVTPAPASGEPGAGDLADVSVRPGRDGGAARLAFGGLVLEQRAVGITATYPTLGVTWNRDEAVAHLRLPTYNCLTAAAPKDPVAAGCAPSLAEYADLPAPVLQIRGEDGGVRLSGRFPTYVRPNGSPPEWTGRVYEFSVRAAPVPGEPVEGWVRAEGEIRLGQGRAVTLDDPGVTLLRRD